MPIYPIILQKKTFQHIHELLATLALLLYNVKKKGKVKAFIDYILSNEEQNIIKKVDIFLSNKGKTKRIITFADISVKRKSL